jgi:hypothetical protein
MHLWVMHPLSAHVLDRLRRGLLDEDLAQSLKRWREAVLEKVASMQFDCVEEPGRQLGVKLPPAPCDEITQIACYMTGVEEKDDAGAGDPEVQGPKRRRPYIPATYGRQCDGGNRDINRELDPHMYVGRDCTNDLLPGTAHYKVGLKSSCVSLLPQWRRKPRYRTQANGHVLFLCPESSEESARRWSKAFALDSRLAYIRSHHHSCRTGCWKKGADEGARFKICRYGFQHEFHVCDYGKKPANKVCKTKNCCRSKDVLRTTACGKKRYGSSTTLSAQSPNRCSD